MTTRAKLFYFYIHNFKFNKTSPIAEYIRKLIVTLLATGAFTLAGCHRGDTPIPKNQVPKESAGVVPIATELGKIEQTIDGSGKLLSTADIPEGLIDAIAKVRKTALENNHRDIFADNSFVAAKIIVNGAGEKKTTGIIIKGVKEGWSSYGDLLEEPNFTVLRIIPSLLQDASEFHVNNLTCKPVTIPLPTPLRSNTLVWLGEIKLVPQTVPPVKIIGTIVDQEGHLLPLNGTAKLGVRGAWPGLSAQISQGRYAFPRVYPGNYWINAECKSAHFEYSDLKVDGKNDPVSSEIKGIMVPESFSEFNWKSGVSDGDWLTSCREAIDMARKLRRPIFIDFTGSDWCGFCQQFEKETLSTPEFAAYATKRLILLKIDLPHFRQQDPKQLLQNQQLVAMYKVEGFPTFLLVSPEGKILFHQEGYTNIGPTSFITKLQAAATADK